jgi:MaoC like domain
MHLCSFRSVQSDRILLIAPVGVRSAANVGATFDISMTGSPTGRISKPETADSDPVFAAVAGFPRPILHGLCTYGMTCKAMVDALLYADTSRVGVVFPGETLKASIWKDGDGFRAVVTAPECDDAVALSDVKLMPA